jgi:hypothetical protein
MASMTDPSSALSSFQEVLLAGAIQLQRCTLHPELHVYADQAKGCARFTYVTLERRTVTAFVNLVLCDPIEGTPCFQIGYAVPDAYRRQGRAKTVVGMAVEELQRGFSGRLGPALYVEAVVGVDNTPSQCVAEQILTATPDTITDEISGLPALRYLRKLDLTSPR